MSQDFVKLTECINNDIIIWPYCLESLEGSLLSEHPDLGLVGPREDTVLKYNLSH